MKNDYQENEDDRVTLGWPIVICYFIIMIMHFLFMIIGDMLIPIILKIKELCNKKKNQKERDSLKVMISLSELQN